MPDQKRRKVKEGRAEPLASSDSDAGSVASQTEDAIDPQPEETGEASSPAKTFKELGVIDTLCEACTTLGYKTATPIQAQAIPVALSGRDLIGLAETGSGKTAAFVIPILQALMEKPKPFFGLILAPTRELAVQIAQSAEALGSVIGVRAATLVGGVDMVPQSIALGKKPHLIVATPGRLIDHMENTRGFSLKSLNYLVLDEADRLLDLDFGPILEKILNQLPKERRTMLFSATISSKVESLQRASLSNPVKVAISSSSYQTVKQLKSYYILQPHKKKDVYLLLLLVKLTGSTSIIFCRTVHETQRIAFFLRALGLSAIPLHGQMSQSSRLASLGRFRSKSRDILVATDVAARGLDIPSVDCVINYDLPGDSKTYIHRVGRTARAGKSGLAISFVTQYVCFPFITLREIAKLTMHKDVELWQRIENALGKQLPEYEVTKDEAMVLEERVSEAQREAILQMKDYDEKKGNKPGKKFGKGKRSRDEMDREQG
ncbi:hypothetical protein N7468_010801 [Penicillium chermesinum]|uniref:ATP-dependent rRNA helicase RRP3 n=1 Tax=Penicillium chermesinum TaxID=63820 RepID=A0A9W9N8F7_9EURO|nr:uncharacterized protein N7468_010801 [Penicillium chermesinum]KAJ5215122.1 hypothetical protein N7468_010801 [Penicillium chermesinum]KAJ6141388.1 hypothetical protein N7470_009778 [Penicillium chermesinum]